MDGQTTENGTKQWVTEIFKRTVSRLGAIILIEPRYQHAGYIVFKNKRKLFFRSERFNINNAGSIETVMDKNYCHFFLKYFGYSVPEGQPFFSTIINSNVKIKKTIDDGYKYASSLGWPVILKPNNASKGRLVTKVENKSDYYKVAKKIYGFTQVMLVERFYMGNDYRIIVFNNRVFAAYQRIPFSITGNGIKKIRALLKEAKTKIELTGNGKLDVKDERIKTTLRKMSLTYDHILAKGKQITLLENANISNGGQMEDITSTIHPTFKRLAVKMARDLNLVLCGIDIIGHDITKPGTDYVVLEINSAPALKHYASIGSFQLRRTESLYTRIFKHLELN
jgi:D-alanine-D-alanine ligase-like ATP-grasp enzyme